MNKRELKKNRFDLEFNFESQKANAVLILLTTGILGFVGNFIFIEGTSFILGIGVLSFIIIFGIYLYYKISKKMRNILNEIENLQ